MCHISVSVDMIYILFIIVQPYISEYTIIKIIDDIVRRDTSKPFVVIT